MNVILCGVLRSNRGARSMIAVRIGAGHMILISAATAACGKTVMPAAIANARAPNRMRMAILHRMSAPGSEQGIVRPQSRHGSPWPRAIRIRQDASVTTAEPAIAVARDQAIDRIADHPWDEVEDPCPLPARKLARNAQRGFGFYIGLAVRHERKGIRAISIDAELLSERTSLGQLDRNEAKIAAAITFADEAAAARA